MLAYLDFSLEKDCICYETLLGKEEVAELTHELNMISRVLESTELVLQES